MTERKTRMSFLKRPYTADGVLKGMQAQHPAELFYLDVGRFGDLLMTLRMLSGGDTISIRLSPEDVARVRELLEIPT